MQWSGTSACAEWLARDGSYEGNSIAMLEMSSDWTGKTQHRLTSVRNRVSSSSAPTARSSVSRTARPNRSSSSARTPAASHGQCCAVARGERASLRYVLPLVRARLRTKYSFDEQEAAKTRRRRAVKSQRAVVGASLDVIKERRSQRPEARSAARAAAIKEGKEKKAASQSVKKAEKAKSATKAASGQSTGRCVDEIYNHRVSIAELTSTQCDQQAGCQGRIGQAKAYDQVDS